MLYLIAFDRTVYTTPVSVGEFLVRNKQGAAPDELSFTELDLPIDADDVLQPALRGGFAHPAGLLVDEGLVDRMTAPQRLEQAAQVQSALADQLGELAPGPVAVREAGFHNVKEQDARDARLDYEEALSWANTDRKDLLARPVDDELQIHWQTRGNRS